MNEIINIVDTPETRKFLDARELQKRSFVFGNCAIENNLITKEMVDEIADRLKDKKQ